MLPMTTIRNADTVLKATDAMTALVLKAIHGTSRAAAREQKGKVSERVLQMIDATDDARTHILSAIEAGKLGDESPTNWSGGSEGLGAYLTGTTALNQIFNAGGFAGPAIADMVQGPLQAQFGLWSGIFTGKEGVEGAPKSVQQGDVSARRMAVQKAYAQAVLTDRLVRFSGAGPLVQSVLRDGTRSAKDKIVVDALVALDQSPLTSRGGTIGDMFFDCGDALAAMDLGPNAKLHWGVSPDVMKYLICLKSSLGGTVFPGLTMAGGAFMGGTVHASDHVGTNVVVIDSSGFVGNDGELVVDSSKYADAIMDNAATPGAAQVVSMFQTNSVIFRAESFFGFEPLRDNVCKTIESIGWGSESPNT